MRSPANLETADCEAEMNPRLLPWMQQLLVIFRRIQVAQDLVARPRQFTRLGGARSNKRIQALFRGQRADGGEVRPLPPGRMTAPAGMRRDDYRLFGVIGCGRD